MRIERDNAILLVVDVQEKLFPHMEDKEGLAQKTLILLKGLQALEVPMLTARQYPKGLGDTIAILQPYFNEYFDKTTFSCCGNASLLERIRALGRKNIIVSGIEAHICVLQTVIDLKTHGFLPVVVTDAVSSRYHTDYETALKRMEQEGAVLTTTESILFELCCQAGTTAFKTISQLVK